MKIWVHTLVKNEERFVWSSIMSVINYVDRILLWDTGSTDGTKEILKEIKKKKVDKVDLKFLDEVTPETFTKARQEMLEATDADWFIVVDGDEIWWDESIKKIVKTIKTEGKTIESIAVPTINLVGDVYHFQEERAGQYKIAGKKGHFNLRAVNREIPGLKSAKPHGKWGWIDRAGRMVQDRNQKKIKFVDAPYLHTSFLQRSESLDKDRQVPKRPGKHKYELGIPLPVDYYYPEVFFKKRPKMIPSPWETMDSDFRLRAFIETPFRKLKRRIITPKPGY